LTFNSTAVIETANTVNIVLVLYEERRVVREKGIWVFAVHSMFARERGTAY
jgi:hypothetical protein